LKLSVNSGHQGFKQRLQVNAKSGAAAAKFHLLRTREALLRCEVSRSW
jgi:hypothetical protein